MYAPLDNVVNGQSRSSILRASQMGVACIELDIRLTQDQHVGNCHMTHPETVI